MKRWIPVITLVFLGLGSGVARADRVDGLIKTLQSNPDVKVRTLTVLSLSKFADPRVATALIATLSKESEDPKVRGWAAHTLGRLKVMGAVRALQQAVRSPDAFLKAKAQAALESLCPSNLTGKRHYINMDKVKASGPSAELAKGIVLMQLGKALASRSDVVTGWPKCGKPTESALRQKRMSGYYMDTSVTVTREAGGKVGCKVSVLFTTFPNQSIKGNAGAKATTPGSLDADTLSALIEQIVDGIKDDIIQFLRSNQN
jgi:hypothetical protein